MAGAPEITRDSRVAQRKSAVSSLVEGEAVILDIDSGSFFQLNPVGSRIWQALQAEMQVGELCARLGEQFDADPETCARDVFEFLGDMSRRGLIVVR